MRKIKKLIILKILLSNILSQSIGSYEILDLSKNARMLALSNSGSAYDAIYLQNNPASISLKSSGNEYSLSYLPADIHLGSIQHIRKINRRIEALRISILNYGKIEDSETQLSSNVFEGLIEIGLKNEFKKITSVGFSFGYVFSSISNYTSHIIFSKIGLRSRLYNKKLGIGLSIENIGYVIKPYTEIMESIPTLFRASSYYEPKYIPLIINIDLIKNLTYNKIYLNGGLEFKFNRHLFFRCGIRNIRSDFITKDFKKDIFAGLSGGLGFQLLDKKLDIGFMNMGAAGVIIGLSIQNKKK